ncbi:MAG: EAL domain-containing protein [Gammaproteobacteria bacterium]|nr:EAL domain-containing protein [Gammaproteobacteria bacterium]
MLSAAATHPSQALEYVPSDAAQTSLRELRLGYVHQQAQLGFICNLALATLLLCLWWPYGNHGVLGGWYLGLGALCLLRMQQRARYLAGPSRLPVTQAEQQFSALVALTGLTWGIGVLLLMTGVPFEHQFLAILVLAGLCAGGIVHLSPVLNSYRLYVPLMLIPVTLWCALHDNAAFRTLALMAVLFGVALLSAGRHYSRHFNRSAELASALQQTEARFASAFHNAPIGMLLIDADGAVVHANRVTEGIYATGADYWKNRPFWALADAVDSARLMERFSALLDGRITEFCLETRQSSSHGAPLWVMVSGSPIPRSTEGGVRAIVQIQDVTTTRIMADRLAYQATHDELTELLNRHEFETRLKRALESIRIDSTQHAVLYLDLDSFKVINDACGHEAGDAMLREVAALLREHVRKHDAVARLGGDEFAILLEHCTRAQASAIADKLCKAIEAHRFAWEDKFFNAGVSIGLVALLSPDSSAASVMKAADAACYAAKEMGRGRVYQFDPDDAELNRHRQQVDSVAVINRALENDRFELHAQPIRATRSRPEAPSTHLEILVRMRDDRGAMISPGLFLPAAERFGLAPRIDRWVIRHACEWFAAHRDCLALIESCSINISGQSLADQELQSFIEQQFCKHHLPPAKFCFEITETAAIASINTAQSFINGLKQLGFRFALDDFGSGLSSFAYLKALPVDVVKIDGIFVRNIALDRLDEAMVRSIAEVARIMDKTTVAEFVEGPQQAEVLTRLGIDYLQGYGIGKPVPLAELFEDLHRATGEMQRIAV